MIRNRFTADQWLVEQKNGIFVENRNPWDLVCSFLPAMFYLWQKQKITTHLNFGSSDRRYSGVSFLMDGPMAADDDLTALQRAVFSLLPPCSNALLRMPARTPLSPPEDTGDPPPPPPLAPPPPPPPPPPNEGRPRPLRRDFDGWPRMMRMCELCVTVSAFACVYSIKFDSIRFCYRIKYGWNQKRLGQDSKR